MIIKGGSRTGGAALGAYLVNAKNERAEVIEIRGAVADDPRGALIEMDALGAGTRSTKPLYHAMISPEPPHRLTAEQKIEAVDTLEKSLGLDGQPRVVVMHEHEGREHLHVVWSRIDLDRMKAIPDSHNYRLHELASRELERRFGHDRVQGVHAERDGAPRPDRTPSRSELRQEERTGVKGRDVKAEVTAAFQASDNGEAFRAALAERGYHLARGDRRDFVIIDQRGGVHSLARRIDGVRAAALREFMSGIDPDSIPSIAEAQRIVEERARRLDERREQYAEDRLGAQYARGDDYVNQSQAAQRDFQRRTDENTERERRRREDEQRKATSEQDAAPTRSDDVTPSRELSDDMQAKLDRLRGEYLESRPAPDPNRQNEAPGGGRTRSR